MPERAGEHRSKCSGYDGRVHFWDCVCGWSVSVPADPYDGTDTHLAAINRTYARLQAHKRRMEGTRPLHAR